MLTSPKNGSDHQKLDSTDDDNSQRPTNGETVTSSPTTSEKLPSIALLPPVENDAGQPPSKPILFNNPFGSSNFLPQGFSSPQPFGKTNYGKESSPFHCNDLRSMAMQRKFSIDVGPFSYTSGMMSPATYQDPYTQRRASMCFEVGMDDYHPVNGMQNPAFGKNDFYYLSPSSSMSSSLKTPSPPTPRNHRSGSLPFGSMPNNGMPPNKHVCRYPYCGWSFKRYEHLKRHMLVHSGARPFHCDHPGCGKSFSRSDNFNAHRRTHEKKNAMRGHNESDPEPGMDQNYDGGDRKVVNYGGLNLGSEELKPTQLTGYNSPLDSPSKSSNCSISMLLNREQRQQEMNGDEGGEHFDYSPPSQMLGENAMPTEEARHQQPVSSFGMDYHYTSTSMLTNTLPLPTPPPQQTNDDMRSLYSDQSDMSATASTKSDGNAQKSHVCTYPNCSKRFKRLEHLKRHNRTHTLERPYACTQPGCNKLFSRSDNLAQHIKTHQRQANRGIGCHASAGLSQSMMQMSSLNMMPLEMNHLGTNMDLNMLPLGMGRWT
ncbi:hypothetical protein BZG36_05232 [Bifiguratus adelaidae]|uniref:C2H2-type domain-containing protein n=1 Tax=Bifiguratus adelaidae TaxID=1938954 RepID=A0A261XUZ1_9FUNG|nr:hypothetical protein BZG36_05232 [Bifiguratus adelaidae]